MAQKSLSLKMRKCATLDHVSGTVSRVGATMMMMVFVAREREGRHFWLIIIIIIIAGGRRSSLLQRFFFSILLFTTPSHRLAPRGADPTRHGGPAQRGLKPERRGGSNRSDGLESELSSHEPSTAS
jgi:hypothetical protein